MMIENGELSPRESMLHQWEVENFEKQAAHAIRIKELELAIKQEENQARIALKKLESRWASWLKIPSMIIKLPLYPILGVGFCIAAAKKHDPGKRFWDLLG